MKSTLNSATTARLLEVATRRLGGQAWSHIAADMGWRSRQAVQQWAYRAIGRWGRAEQRQVSGHRSEQVIAVIYERRGRLVLRRRG